MLIQPTFPGTLIHHAMRGSELEQNPEIPLSGLPKSFLFQAFDHEGVQFAQNHESHLSYNLFQEIFMN
mgnify:FL=1